MPTFVHGKSTDFELDDTSGTSRSLANTLTSVDFPETIGIFISPWLVSDGSIEP